MVEVKNLEVFGLDRALNAKGSSFNVGEIDTTLPFDKTDNNKQWQVAKSLGGNMFPHQSHDAFIKGILVIFDIKGNGVFMPEFQRYHFADIVMSQSTMHSMDKFMTSDYDPFTKYVSENTKKEARANYERYVEAKKSGDKQKIYEAFEIMVHNLPRGLELWATVTTNYLQLKTIVIQRFHHKNIEDWRAFVEACYKLPYFRELCGFTDPQWDLSQW
ncbi:MAG: hypothetical protein MST05_04120 [Treponema sp.]|nr:hypothetical protein [Treponema sp.]